jgi:hypothetical protein
MSMASLHGRPKVARRYVGTQPNGGVEGGCVRSDARRVRKFLGSYLELWARIDDPLSSYGFAQHALFVAVQRGDLATIDMLLGAGADIRKRTELFVMSAERLLFPA